MSAQSLENYNRKERASRPGDALRRCEEDNIIGTHKDTLLWSG